jgi:hypothetical protein
MNEYVFTRYPKECLLKAKQIPNRVGDPPKKHALEDKTKPLGSQKVGPKNGQLKITWLKHFVVPFGMGK